MKHWGFGLVLAGLACGDATPDAVGGADADAVFVANTGASDVLYRFDANATGRDDE